MISLEVFKSFYSEEEAFALRDLLLEKGIEAKVEKTRAIIDKVIVGDGDDPHIHVIIKNTDFTRANQIVDEYISQHLHDVDPDYYLFDFSNNELLEIIHKPDEWNNQDVMIAKKILADRNQSISDQQVNAIKEARYKELAKPEKSGGTWLIIGYIGAVFFSLFALIIALFLRNSKKVMPDGTKLPVYDKNTRFHCDVIIGISAFIIVAFFLTWQIIPSFFYYIRL